MFHVQRLARTIMALFLLTTMLVGCSLYRPDLRQGNFITQADLNRLKPEMTKYQVQEIMGSPALSPVLNLEQWNYTYAYIDGQHRDQPLKFKTISLGIKAFAATSLQNNSTG